MHIFQLFLLYHVPLGLHDISALSILSIILRLCFRKMMELNRGYKSQAPPFPLLLDNLLLHDSLCNLFPGGSAFRAWP